MALLPMSDISGEQDGLCLIQKQIQDKFSQRTGYEKQIPMAHLKTVFIIEQLKNVMRKPVFCIYAKTKAQIRCAVTAQLIGTIVFAIYKASSLLLWLYSLVCVGPGWKPQRQGFSRRGSISNFIFWGIGCNISFFNEIHVTNQNSPW